MAKRKKKAVNPKVSKKKKVTVPQDDVSESDATDRPSSAKKMAATSSTSQLEDELEQVPCFNTITLNHTTKTDHGELAHFWCKYCEFSAGSMQELVPHMGQHIIKCSYCSFNSFSRSEVVKHSKSEHDKDLKCSSQEVDLPSGDYDMDKDPCTACMFCDFMTYSTMHLERHTVTKHPGMHAKSVAKMITKHASAQVRKEDANFYQTISNNVPDIERDSKIAQIVIDPDEVRSPKDIKPESNLGLLDEKPKQAVLQEKLARDLLSDIQKSFLGKSVAQDISSTGELSSPKSSKDWAVKVEIMYCLSCPYSNAYIEKLKCHSLVQHPVGAAAVTFNSLGELASAEDITFYCVREDCSFSSGDSLSYQRHLMCCCSSHSSMSVLEKERLTSTISYILNYLKKLGIKEESGFTEFASLFLEVPIALQAKQSCPAAPDSQNFLQTVHSSENVYKFSDQHNVSRKNSSGSEHRDSVAMSARPNSNPQTALREDWKYGQYVDSAPQSSGHDVVSTSTPSSNVHQLLESHPQQQQYPLQQLIGQQVYPPSNSMYNNQPESLATSGLINHFPSDQRYNTNISTNQKPAQNYSPNSTLDPRALNVSLLPSEPEPNRNSFDLQPLNQGRQNLSQNDPLLSSHHFDPNANSVQEFSTFNNYNQNILHNNIKEISYGLQQVIPNNLSSVPVNQGQNNTAGSYLLPDSRDSNRQMVNTQGRTQPVSHGGNPLMEQTLGNQSHLIPSYGSVQVQGNQNQSLNLTVSQMAPVSEMPQESSSNVGKPANSTQHLDKIVEENILQIPPAPVQQNHGLASYTAVDNVQGNYDFPPGANMSSTSRLDSQTGNSQSNLPNFLVTTNTPMAASEHAQGAMMAPALTPRSHPPRQPAPQGFVTPPKNFNTPGNVVGSSPLSPSIYLSGQAPRHRRTSWTDADMRPKGMLPPMHTRAVNPGIPPYPQGHHARQRLFSANPSRGYGIGEASRGTRGRGRGRAVHFSRSMDNDDDVIVVGEQFRQRSPARGRGVPLNYPRGVGQTPPRFSKPNPGIRAPSSSQKGAPPPKLFDISKHFEDLACVVNSTGDDEEAGRGDEDLQIVGVTLASDKSSQPKAVDASKFSFCCVHCGKDQGSKNVMKQHMKVSHNDTLLGAFTNVETGQLLFFCPQLTCEFMTYDETRLSEHLTKCYNLDSAKSVDFETAVKNLKSLKIRQLDVRSMGSHDNPIHLDGQGMKDNFSSSLNDAFDDIVVNTSGRHITKQTTPKQQMPPTQLNPSRNPPHPGGPVPTFMPSRQQQGYPGMRQKFPVNPYRTGRPHINVNRPMGFRNMRQHHPAMHSNYRQPVAVNANPGMGVKGMYPRMRPPFVRALPPPPPPPHAQQPTQAGGEQEPIVIDLDEDDDDNGHRKGSGWESASSHGQYPHNGQMGGFSGPVGITVPDAGLMTNESLTTSHESDLSVRDNFLNESYPTYGNTAQLPTSSQHNSTNNELSGNISSQIQLEGTQVPSHDSVSMKHGLNRPARGLFDGSPVMHSSSQSSDQVDPTAALQIVVKTFPKLQLPNQGAESGDYYHSHKQNPETGDCVYSQKQNAERGSNTYAPVPYTAGNNNDSSSLESSASESFPYEQSSTTASTAYQQNSQKPGSSSESIVGQQTLNTSIESTVVPQRNISSSQGIDTSTHPEYFNEEEKIYAIVLEKVFAKVPNMPKHLSHRLVSKFKEYLNYRGVKITSDSNVIDEFVSKISYKGSNADKMGAKSLPLPPALPQPPSSITTSPITNERDEPPDTPDSAEPPNTPHETCCNREQPHDQSEDNPRSEQLSPPQNDLSEVIATHVILRERNMKIPGLFPTIPPNPTALNNRKTILVCDQQQQGASSSSHSSASFLPAEDLQFKLVNQGIKDNPNYLGESEASQNDLRDPLLDSISKKLNGDFSTSVDISKPSDGNELETFPISQASNIQDHSTGDDSALETFPGSQASNIKDSSTSDGNEFETLPVSRASNLHDSSTGDNNALETLPDSQASNMQDHSTSEDNALEISPEILKSDNDTLVVKSCIQKDTHVNDQSGRKFLLNPSKAPARRFSANPIDEVVRCCKVRRSGSFPVYLSTMGQISSKAPSKNDILTSPVTDPALPELANNLRPVCTPLSNGVEMGLEVCIPSAPYVTQDHPVLSLKEVIYPSPSISDKDPILITSSVDYLVSGHADLEVDIAGKPDDSHLLHVGKFEPPDDVLEQEAGIMSEGRDKLEMEQRKSKRKSKKKFMRDLESTVSAGLTKNKNVLYSTEKKITHPKKGEGDLKSNMKSRFVDQKTGKLILKVSKRGRPRKLAESREKVKKEPSKVQENISEDYVSKEATEEGKEATEEDKEVTEEDKEVNEPPEEKMSSLEPSKELISELAVRRSDRKRKIIKSDYRSELADIDDFISDSGDEYNIDDDDSESDCKWKTDSGNSNVLKKRVRKAKAPPDLTAFNTSTKGKYKCWLCKKTFLKCIGGKAHIIKKHKQGFCTIDMVQVEETNEPHLLLYCPRECKYATFSLEGLKNHLACCEKPLLKEDGENWLEINTNFIDTLYPELLKTGVNDLLGASNAKPATKDPAKVVKRKKKKSTSESVTSTASVLISHAEAQVTVDPDDNVIKVSKTSAEQATSNSTPIKTFGATQVTGSVTANMCDTLASSTISSPQSLSLGSPCHIPIVSRPHLVSNMHQQILNAHPIPLHPQSGLTHSGSAVQAQFVARQSAPMSHPRIAYSQNAHTNNVHSQVPKSQQSNSRFVTPSIRQDTPRFSQSLSVASSTSSSKQMPPSPQQQQYRFEQSNFAPRMHHPGAFETSPLVNRQYSHPIPRPNHHLKAVNQSLKPNVRAAGQQEAFSAPHKPTVAHQHGANQSRTCQDADIYMIEDNGTICIE